MTDRTFARLVLKHIVDDAVTEYSRQLRKPLTKAVTDPLWRQLQAWAVELPRDKQDLVVAFARQSAIDAVAGVLGVLDGTSGLPGVTSEMRLFYGSSKTPLNGDLQDSFLEAVEEDAPDPWLRSALAESGR